MVRLFLKLYGLLIATLAVSFVLQMQVMDYVWRELTAGFDFRARFRPAFHLVERALEAHPEEEWSRRFAELSAGFGTPARILPADQMSERERLKPEQRATFDRGGIVSVERPGGGFIVFKRMNGGTQAVAIEHPGPDSKRVKLINYGVNWAVEFAMVAVLLFFWVRPFWRDLLRLRDATEQVAAGRFEARARVGKRSPLAPLATAFDAMTLKVDALMRSHRTLTSAVSHELRTPLARLRFSHSLAREARDAATKDRHLERMERDFAEVDELTSELLDYARLERGGPPIRMQVVPAGPWLEDLLADLKDPGSFPPAIALKADVALDQVRCEPRYMGRAVTNLVRNAATHARGHVLVSVREESNRTVVSVDDDGPGIPPADRERVLEPFVRLDESRARRTGGFGLGLAIVRQIAQWHGGQVAITDSPLGGTRVSVSW